MPMRHQAQPKAASLGEQPTTPAGRAAAPLVSIVTPSYNQGQFIGETIASVLGQDYPHIEYWVIDGGSGDATLDVLRQFEHDARLHWISEPDGGQSDAINKGVALCHGELFAWLNSDDRLLPGALRRVVDAWAADQPAIVYGRARLIDQEGRDLGYFPAQSSQMTLQQILSMRYFLAQPATFAPTETIRKVGGVDQSLHYAMDFDLWVKLAELLPIRHVPHDLAEFRMHAGSKTVSAAPRFIADVAAVLDRAARRELLPARQARVRASLFAMRTYLLPESVDLGAALASLRAAGRADLGALPEGLFVFVKALVRLAIGERVWSWVRWLWLKLS